MTSNYPLQIDTALVVVTNTTPVTPAIHNEIRASIISIQSELGIKPSGTYGTVRSRLDGIDNVLDALQGTLTPGGPDRSVQFNHSGVYDGAAHVSISSSGNLQLSNSLGGMAQSGELRFAFGSSVAIRNQNNTADLLLMTQGGASDPPNDGYQKSVLYLAGGFSDVNHDAVNIFSNKFVSIETQGMNDGYRYSGVYGWNDDLYASNAGIPTLGILAFPNFTVSSDGYLPHLIGSADPFSGGAGVVLIKDVAAFPTGNPTTGFYLWSDPTTHHPMVQLPVGTIFDLTSGNPGGATGSVQYKNVSAGFSGASFVNISSGGYLANPLFIANDSQSVVLSISDGSGAPTSSSVDGSLYMRSDGYANNELYIRRSGAWYPFQSSVWTAGNDLSGNSTTQTVIGIQNRSVSSAVPSDRNVLSWNQSGNHWVPSVVPPDSWDLRYYGTPGISTLADTALVNSALTSIGSSGMLFIPPNCLYDPTQVTFSNNIIAYDNANQQIIVGTVSIGKALQAGGGHILVKNAAANTAGRLHIEPNGYPTGTKAKVDVMFDPYETDGINYRLGNMFTTDGTAGQNGIFVIGSKGVGDQFGVFPSINVGFSDNNSNGVPLKVMYFDTSDSAWRTPQKGAWRTGMSITSGDYVLANFKLYQSGTTATTGSTKPNHSTGIVSDGYVNWTFVRDFTGGAGIKPLVLIGDRDDMPKFGLPNVRLQLAKDFATWNGVAQNYLDNTGAVSWKESVHTNTTDFFVESADGYKSMRFSNSGFYQFAGMSHLGSILTIANNSATPTVSATEIAIFNNSTPTTITALTGSPRQILIVQSGNGNTTLQNNSNIILNTGTDKILTANSCLTFVFDGGGTVAKEVNSGFGNLNYLALGTNPALSGIIRLPNNQFIAARNFANTADGYLLGLDTSDKIRYGSASNITGHVFNTPSNTFYDFQFNSTSSTTINDGYTTISRNSIGNNSLDGLVLQNTTAGTIGIPAQRAPRLRLYSEAYDTNSTLSVASEWRIESLPTSGNPVSGTIKFSHQLAGSGGFADVMTIGSGGTINNAVGNFQTNNGQFISNRPGATLASPIVGVIAQNTTAAANGSQQAGPMLSSIGQGWDSTAGASKPVEFGLFTSPVQNAGNPTGTFSIFSRSNNGAWTNNLGLTSAGGLTVGGNIVASTSITANLGNITASGGAIIATRNSIGAVSTTGFQNINNTVAILGTQQWSPRTEWQGNQWDTTLGASATVAYFAEVQTVQGADESLSHLVWSRSNNGGSKTILFNMSNAGNFTTIGSVNVGTSLTTNTAANIGTTIVAGTGITATTGNIVASAGVFSVKRNNISTTNNDGLIAGNDTAATLSIPVQYSPDIRQYGSAWNSTGSANEVHEYRWTVRPATAAGTTSSIYALQRQIALGGFSDVLTVNSAGSLVTTNGTFSGTISSASITITGTTISVSKSVAATTASDGVFSTNTGVAANNAQRWSPAMRWTGAGWNPTASASRVVDWRTYTLPIQSASNEPTVDLVFENQINAAGFVEGFRLKGNATGAQAITTINALAQTPTPGYITQNNTAAANAAQQIGPGLSSIGQGWDSTASSSKPVEFMWYTSPVQAAGNPTGNYVVGFRSNNGSWSFPFSVSGTGVGTFASTLSATAMLATGNIATTGGFVSSTRAGIGIGTTDGLIANNTTAAALGAQQWSPRLHLQGNQWDTTLGASASVDFYAEVQTAQGADESASNLVWSRSNNGGAKTALISFTNAGQITAANGLVAQSNGIASTGGITCVTGNVVVSTGQLQSNINNVAGSVTTDGLVLFSGTAATIGTVAQTGTRLRATASAWNSVGAVAEQHDWVQFVVPTTAAGTTSSVWKMQRQIAAGGYVDAFTMSSGGTFSVGGSISTTAAITAGTGITATTGNIQASAGSLTSIKNNISITSTDGITLQNTTSATNAIPVQYSPRVRFFGDGYNSVSGLSETQEWIIENQPVSAAGATTSRLIFANSLNGASYVNQMSITSAGIFTSTGGMSTNNGAITVNVPNITTVNTDGIAIRNGIGATVGVPVQYSPDIRQLGFAWNSVGAVSESHEWRSTVVPATAAGTTSSQWVLSRQVAAGGYTTIYSVTSGGTAQLNGAFTATTGLITTTGNIQANAGTITTIRSAIATTSTDGLIAQNATNATSGIPVQYSPGLRFDSSAYNSVSTLAETHNWRHEVRPATAAGTTSSTYVLSRQIAAGGYSDQLTISSAGTLTTTGGINATGSIFASGGGFVTNRNNITTTSTDGVVIQNTTLATNGSPIQYSPRLHFVGDGYNSVSGLSEIHDWIAEVRPTTAAGTTASLYALGRQIAAGGYSDMLTISSGGTTNVVGLSATSTIFSLSTISSIRNAIAATTTDGLINSNTTAATSGVPVQYSPRLRWVGQAWNTTSIANETRSVSAELRSISGSSTAFNWVLARDSNDVGGVVDLLTISGSGGLTVPVGKIESLIGVAANTVQIGYSARNPNTATSGNQRYSTASQYTGAGWNPTASASRIVDWRLYNIPIQQASNEPTTDLVFENQVNAAGFVEGFRLKSAPGGGYGVFSRNALGSVSDVAIAIQNTTAATSGQQQFSPMLVSTGQGWNSTAGASQTVDWCFQSEPVSTAGVPNSAYKLYHRENAGSWINAVSVNNDGYGGYQTITRGGLTLAAPDRGLIVQNTTAAALGAQQAGPMLSSVGQGWDSTNNVSKPVEFAWFTDAVQQAGNPTGNMRLYNRINNGSWNSTLSITSTGAFTSIGGIVSGTTLITTNGRIESRLPGIGVTSTDGIATNNATAAALGAQQWSPRLHFQGQQWDTTLGASVPVDFYAEIQTVQGTDESNSALVWSRSNNGGAKTNIFTIGNNGAIVSTGTITSGGNIQTSTGALIVTKAGIATTNTIGLNVQNTTLSIVGATVQQSPDIVQTGHAWNSVGAVDEEHDWRTFILPTTAAGTTSSTWRMQRQIAAGGYIDAFIVSSSGSGTFIGNLTVNAALVVGTSITATNGAIVARAHGFGVTNTDGVVGENTTVSTVGTTVQQSPDMRLTGHAWNSTGAVNEQHDWRAFVLPATAAGTTSSTWKVQSQVAAGGYSDRITITASGLTVASALVVNGASGITASTGPIIANAAAITAVRNSIGTVSTIGISAQNPQVSSGVTQNQWSPQFRAFGTVWDGSASQNVIWKHEVQTTAGASYAGDYVFSYTDGAGTTAALKMLGKGGVFVANDITTPATPTGGGVLYVEGGAHKYIGSSGTITTLGPA